MTQLFGLERWWVEPEKVMSQWFEEPFSGSPTLPDKQCVVVIPTAGRNLKLQLRYHLRWILVGSVNAGKTIILN
jgi:hypothetical protein